MCQFAHLGVRYGDKCLDIGLLKHWGTNLCGVCIPQEGAAEGFFVSVSAILYSILKIKSLMIPF
ncbi:hypothetical protein GAY80_21710 [Phocaeicola vulgatus]|uniref:Uncharacterized protein n=1 Tax=Phocaeicola vulgatus TaxID=821 RepID=A0A7J5RBR1_PHOVU|nr:hypothetical protein GAY80_21710 [Phocaeicola vulgatus]KAB6554171.1 hypothetical protein GAY79_22315 [Phocaeicola vulgatus]KAB6559062.1 hypothetical protein GAY82_21700 [Phocaeicola vulgatus]KAB6561850.1 hypothetical protein GAY81_23380 [Phocaeicola vulgatus]KAB6571477.1 hypothetical protein GAY84_22355 [Phocaeicola vulgatus]